MILQSQQRPLTQCLTGNSTMLVGRRLDESESLPQFPKYTSTVRSRGTLSIYSTFLPTYVLRIPRLTLIDWGG